MKYGAVIIETRCFDNLPELIMGSIAYLPNTWGITIFHGDGNGEMLIDGFRKKKIGHPHDVKLINLEKETLDSTELNRLLTSAEFWEMVPYDKILMFHLDSMMLRGGIEEFIEWDYVGAPWATQQNGGNGGFSIRSKRATLKLIKQLPYRGYEIHDNEDRWVSNHLHLIGGRIAPREVCLKFSCESIFQLGTLGYHVIHKYLTDDECHKILHQYD